MNHGFSRQFGKIAFIFVLGMVCWGVIHNNKAYFYKAYHAIKSHYQNYVSYLNPPDVAWTMVNVNGTTQGDAHVIQIKEGKTVLIDAGAEVLGRLVPFLQANYIDRFDLVFISHPHKDHYEGIAHLLKHGIQFKEIYFNLPDKSICDKERPWGCDYSDIKIHFNLLKKHGIPRKTGKQGQSFDLGKNTRIKILYAYDGVNTPVGETDINDTSLIMLLEHKDHKFLFAGDLNEKLGKYLAENAADIEADVLKVPHHGTERLAPNIFFKKVNPKYALVPSPKHLWCSNRSARPRNWFKQNKIPTFVNGFSENVKVQIDNNELLVIPEVIVANPCPAK